MKPMPIWGLVWAIVNLVSFWGGVYVWMCCHPLGWVISVTALTSVAVFGLYGYAHNWEMGDGGG